jgi:hypothetical protein
MPETGRRRRVPTIALTVFAESIRPNKTATVDVAFRPSAPATRGDGLYEATLESQR